ncbi:MAG: helix-turn-helix domain-containing protein, partial [Anaerolineae bacterium]|nr:helix-turn-helix domain-containing protein [Anaerolineae bacterium]
RIRHANMLLAACVDGGNMSDQQIAEAFSCHRRTVENLRQRFVEQGLEAALERKKRAHPPRERLLDGDAEAKLIALCCSQAPEGRSRWTLHLLADKLVELQIVYARHVYVLMRCKSPIGDHLCLCEGAETMSERQGQPRELLSEGSL